ncbi:MAG TPA: hypothetical protein VIC05_00650 [Solirubrobacteraceae bacterium]|jgi:hypothetical protein
MHEDAQQTDLVIKVQQEIAERMRELDLAIDSYAKLLVELEILEIQARSHLQDQARSIYMSPVERRPPE